MRGSLDTAPGQPGDDGQQPSAPLAVIDGDVGDLSAGLHLDAVGQPPVPGEVHEGQALGRLLQVQWGHTYYLCVRETGGLTNF